MGFPLLNLMFGVYGILLSSPPVDYPGQCHRVAQLVDAWMRSGEEWDRDSWTSC